VPVQVSGTTLALPAKASVVADGARECRTASQSPKYEDENLGCGFNSQFVGFAHLRFTSGMLRKGRLVEEVVQ
jgi:hypothetical protein